MITSNYDSSKKNSPFLWKKFKQNKVEAVYLYVKSFKLDALNNTFNHKDQCYYLRINFYICLQKVKLYTVFKMIFVTVNFKTCSLISVYSNLKHGCEGNTMAKNIIYTKSKLLQRSDVINTD